MRGRAKREPLRCRARPALWAGSRAFAFCSLAPLWFSAWNSGPRLLLAPGLILVRVCGPCRSPGLSGVSDLQGSLRFLFSSALGVTGWKEQSIPCLTVPLGQQLWLEASDPAMWKSSQCGCRSPCSPVLTVPWAALRGAVSERRRWEFRATSQGRAAVLAPSLFSALLSLGVARSPWWAGPGLGTQSGSRPFLPGP